MAGKTAKKYLSLREAAKMFGYSSDYIGSLVRDGKVEGKKAYSGISWQLTPQEILKYCGYCSAKKDIRFVNQDNPLLKKKFLSLQEAAEISGYSADYIGQLLRKEIIKGKKFFTQTFWLVNGDDLKKYQTKELTPRNAVKISEPPVFGLPIWKRKGFSWGLRLSFTALVIFSFVSGLVPVKFLQSSLGAIFVGDTKIINFYSNLATSTDGPPNGEASWENPENVQGPPNLEQDANFSSFSESNSAVYQTGPLAILIGGFESAELTPGVDEKTPGVDAPVEETPGVSDETPVVDEPVCENGANRPCSSDVGQCQIGVQVCSNGAWGACLGAVMPRTEICDAVDNDCNGEIDDGENTCPFGPYQLTPAEPDTSFLDTIKDFFGFKVNAQGKDFSAKIKFSFAMGEKEQDISLEQTSSTEGIEINTTSSEPINFWERIKNFFTRKSRVVPIARAQEIINENETTTDAIMEVGSPLNNENETTSDETIDIGLPLFLEKPEVGGEQFSADSATTGDDLEKADKEKKEKIKEKEATTSEDILLEAATEGGEPRPEESGREPEVGGGPSSATSSEDIRENPHVNPRESASTTDVSDDGEENFSETTTTDSEVPIMDMDARIIVFWSLDGEVWKQLGTISEYPTSNELNGGYFEFEAPFLNNFDDVKNLKLKFEGLVGGETSVFAYLDSVWVEVKYSNEQGTGDRGQKKDGSEEPEEKRIEALSEKKDFQLQEEPEFKFHYNKIEKDKNFLAAVGEFLGVIDEWRDTDVVAEANYRGPASIVETEVVLGDDGDFSVKIKKPREFKPGTYKLTVKIGSQELIQDFTWGVLAINVNKSIYLPDETVYIQMASLDEFGHTICDANLQLEIIPPNEGSPTPLNVERSGKCAKDNITDTPDYFAYYKLSTTTGTYQMRLTLIDTNTGAKVHEITDSFEVRESVPFDIERIGPTRIYPRAGYEMKMIVKVNEDFVGRVIETVPVSFAILGNSISLTPGVSSSTPGVYAEIEFPEISSKRLVWSVDWKEGENYELKYRFDAPDISPYLYLLGPLEFFERDGDKNIVEKFIDGIGEIFTDGTRSNANKNTNGHENFRVNSFSVSRGLVFSEARAWQVAADAPDLVIEQQINIIDQKYSTSSASAWPTDNSLGLIRWTGGSWSGTDNTVYFEAILSISNDTIASSTLYTSAGVAVAGTTLKTQSIYSTYTRLRSGNIASSLASGTDYTVRIASVNGSGTASIKAARLIIVQSTSTGFITDTETQVEVGNASSTIIGTSYTTTTDPKIYYYDQDKFSPTPSPIYFETTMKNDNITASASTVGPTDCVTTANVDTGGAAWGTLSNACGTADAYATVSAAGTTPTDYLKVTNFGFNITAGSTVQGIEATIEAKSTATQGKRADDYNVYIVKGNSIRTTSTDHAATSNWPTSDTVNTYPASGGSTDTWGVAEGWDSDAINNSGFGLAFEVYEADNKTVTVSVDNITLKVYYTTPSGIATTSVVLWNKTDNIAVDNSTTSTSTTSWVRARSGDISANLTSGKEYIVKVKTSDANATGSIANAKIILVQSDTTNGIDSLETYSQYINTATSTTATSYASTTFYNYYDPSNWSGGTATRYFEATMMAPSGQTISADLATSSNDTITNSEISTTSASYVRQRSASALTINQSTATNTDTRVKVTAGTGMVHSSWLIHQISGLNDADLSWVTSSAAFKIYQSGSLSWNAGTLKCSGTLTDDNNSTVSCSGGTISPSTQYRVDVQLMNTAPVAASMQGTGDAVALKNITGGWGGTTPLFNDAAFYDPASGGVDGATTAATSTSGNDFRLTNTGAGNVVIGALTGFEGFMFLITTGSDVPTTDSTGFASTTIDAISEDSSKITISGPTVSVTQRAFIFQNDDGSEVNGNSNSGSANTTSTPVKKGERLIARFQIDETGGGATSTTLKLQYNTGWNSNSWVDVMGSGPPSTNSGASTTDWNATTVDSTSAVGSYTSIAIGTDGLPIVSYYDTTNLNLNIAKCNTEPCTTSSNWSTTSVDGFQGSDVGGWTSIAIGADGLPIVSYYDSTNGNLNIAKCTTEPCTTQTNWSTTTPDSTGNVGQYTTSIAIGTDGLPVVSYYDNTNDNLNIAKCNTSPCTQSNQWSTTTPDSTGTVGYFTSIAIGTDGLPIVSYNDITNGNLNIAKCDTSPCTQSNQWSTTSVDGFQGGDVGQYTSIAIGTDGLPIVSYYNITNGNLNIAKCDTSPCTQSNQWSTTSVDGFQGGDVGYFTSIAIGRDGFPIISYQDITNAAMKIAKCNDMACSGGDEAITTVNDLGDTINSGGYNSIAIGKDGWPWVSYFDDDNDDLKVAHMSPLAEIQPALGLSGANGAALTSAAIAGGTGTWQNGEWYEATTTSRAITLAANYYTELAFVLDTREATASTTYRLRLVQSGGGLLNGGYANYPAFTIVSSTDNKMRYSKEAILTGASNASTSDWNATTVDSTGTVGYYTSIAIGTDGLPVVSYRDVTNGNLNIAKCNTEPCTTATNWSTTTPDSISNVGQFTSIAIGTDGLPVVSYRDVTNGNLNIAKCNTEPCTTATNWSTTTPDSTNDVGWYTSIAIGADGLPIVSYYDITNENLNIAKCNTAPCTAANQWSTTTPDSTGTVGIYTSIAIGTDGLPIVSYYDGGSNGNLNIAKCNTEPCTTATNWSTTTPDSISTVGLHTSIAIGIDGLPIVSYYDNSNGNLNIAKCNTAPCTAANQWSTTTPDSTGTVGLYTSMAIGRDGFPIISYQDVTNAAMKIAKCNDMACSGGDETITTVNDLGTAADSGGYTSIAIGKDGYPWVSYFDNDNNDLKVAKQLGLPTMAIGYFNRTTKTDGQAKVTRTRWTKTSTSSNSMIIEQSPMIEDGLAYWFDKAGYAAVTADDTATTTITSSGNSSATTTPLFYFAEKHTSSTLPLYARWIGQSTVAAGTKNIKLEVFKFGATSSDTKWYTLDTDSSCNANSDCDLQGSTTTDLSYFYFPEYNFDESRGSVLGTSTYPTYGTTTLAEFWTFWRVYQDPAIGGQDLKSDYWKVQSTGDTDVSTFGTQNSPMYIPSNNNYVGGGFAVPSNYGSRNVTGIIITENGTVNAQTGLGNVALYYGFDTSAPYDCSGESLGGTQFGATTTFNGADGTASFTGSAAISTTQTLCVYTLLNVASGASDGQTLEIKINNPLSDVTVSSGGVSPITAVEIPGTTNLTVLPSTITQRAFIFQNDDGSEVNGNSNSGSANTTSTPVKKGERLIARFQIDETGGVATTTSFKLQYNTGWVGDWVDVMGSGPPSTNKYASTSDWNATTVDSTGSVGDSYTSIAISADGLPIVSYRDTTNLNLNIAKCTAEPCTTQSNWTTTSPDGYQGGSVGTFTSIAIGADGLPIVSYYDNTNLNLNIAKCNTSPCTQANQWSTTSPDSTGSVGTFTSIAIGADGLPIVSYLDYTGSTGNLNIAKCTAEPCTTQTNWSTTSVDGYQGGDVGTYTSIAIGADGLPIVSYFDSTRGNLNIAKCNQEPCTTQSNWSTTTVDGYQGGSVGYYTSIAISADGLPIVSYFDSTRGNLNIAKCNTSPCTTQSNWTTTTPDSTGTVGYYTSIAIGADGLPIVSYLDYTGSTGNLNIAKCTAEPCTTQTNWSTTSVDGYQGGDVGTYTSIAIGADGLPIVSYFDSTRGNLNIAKCNQEPCTTQSNWSTTTVDGYQGGSVGYYTSIAISADGLPIVAHYNGTDFNLNIAKCNQEPCTTASNWSTTTPDSTDSVGRFTSIAIGRDGFPVISYQDSTNAALKIAKCNDIACSGKDETVITVNDMGTAANSGGYTSIAIGKDGWPWVSYYDDDSDDLKVAHMSPLTEIQPALGLSGVNGASLTSAAIAGGTGTWQNGEWYEATTTSRAITLAANYYTELAFVLDTREATASTTYRLRLVHEWGDTLAGGYANYPAFTIVSSTDNKMRYSKEAILTAASNASTTDWSVTTTDSTGNVGQFTSLAIGTDGLPIVSYYDTTNGNLNIAKCNTAPCTSSNQWSTTTVDGYQGDNVGSYTSLAIGADGLPRVSYYSVSNVIVFFAQCTAEPCTTQTNWSTTSVGPFLSGTVNIFTSLAIGADGLPIMSYFDSPGSDLQIAKCTAEPCTTQTNWSSTSVDGYQGTGIVGRYTSIAIGTDGLPIVSYYNVNKGNLNIAKCNQEPCTTATNWSTTTPDSTGDVGQYTSLAIGTDGLPIVSYYDVDNGNLNVAKCNTSPCTQANQWSTTTPDSTGNVGQYTSIAIGRDGFPVISYQDVTNGALNIAWCTREPCTTQTNWSTSTAGYGGQYTSIAIGKDGYPWVSYYEPNAADLKVAKQLGLPTMAIGYFNRTTKTDGQAKVTRTRWTGNSTSSMIIEQSPMIEDGLAYWFDKAGYTAVQTDDTATTTITSSGDSSATTTPLFYFAEKHTATSSLYARWIGQSTVAAGTKNIKLEVFKFGATSSDSKWYTLDTDSSCNADSDCDLQGSTTTDLNYFFYPEYNFDESRGSVLGTSTYPTYGTTTLAEFWTFWRVYQDPAVAGQDLKTDLWKVQSSAFSTLITVSGVVYTDEGKTTMATGRTVTLAVNGVSAGSDATDGSGAYAITNVTINNVDDVLTAFLDGMAEKAVAVSNASSTSVAITDLDLYQNRVIVRDQGGGASALTNTNMDQYDSGNDSDIQFTVSGTSLTVATSSKLYIWPNKTFAPGGTITLLGNAQASPSGDIHIANGATLTAGGNISVAGNWIASSTATFTPSTYTVTMTATTTGKEIWTVPVSTAKFYDLTFNGSGGAWTFKSSSATTTNNFTITLGTVTAPTNLYVGNNFANSATFTHNSGAVWMTGTGGSDTVTPGSSTFYDLTFNGSGGSWSFGTNSATTTNNFFITLGTVTAPTNLYITGNYSNSGTFTHNSGRIIFNATGAKTITAGGVASDFFQLDFNGAGGQWTFVGAATSTATTTITQGTVIQAAAANLDLASFNIGASGVFTAASGVGVIYFEDDDPIFIADNRASKTTLGNVYIGYSPAIANQSSDLAVTSLTINSGDTHNTRGYEIDSSGAITVNGTGVLNANSSAAGETNGSVITVGTDWTIGASATFTAEEPGSASTTVYFDENTAGTITPGGTDANHDFWNFIVQKSAAQTVTLAGAIDVNNDIEITGSNSTFDVSASNYAITAGGSWLNTGNFTARSATTTFDSSALTETITPGSSAFYNLAFNNASGGWTISGTSATSSNDFTIFAGNVTSTSGIFYIGRNASTSAAAYFGHNSGTVNFYGTASGILRSGCADVDACTTNADFYNVEINKTGVADADDNLTLEASHFRISKTLTITDGELVQGNLNVRVDSLTTVGASGSWTNIGTGDLTIGNTFTNSGTSNITFNTNNSSCTEIADDILIRSTTTDTQVSWVSANAITMYNVSVRDQGGTASITVYSGASVANNGTNWTFANCGVRVSGTLYSNEGGTQITSGGQYIALRVNGSAYYTTTTYSGTGAWYIDGVANLYSSEPIVVYVTTSDFSVRAAAVTTASTSDGNIIGLDLYQNRVIVKHEGTSNTSTDLAKMSQWDSSDDSQIQFTAVTSTSLTVATTSKLYIWPNKTFAPGGTIATLSNALASPSGDLQIASGATLTAGGNISVSGNWIASSTATFTPGTNTVTMTASTTGKEIWAVPAVTADFYNLTFNGSGGGWTFKTDATTTNNFNINAGTATLPSNLLYVGGNFFADDAPAAFIHNSGTVLFNSTASGKTVDDGGSSFYNITFNGAGGTWLYQDGTSTNPNQLTVQNGTTTMLNAKTGASPSVSGTGELLVDWYLGSHLVDATNTSLNIDTDGCNDITISENTASSTIYRYTDALGWGSLFNSTTTGTGTVCGGPSAGINPQPGTAGAIRIRDYRKTAAETNYYKYNLQLAWQNNWGEYNWSTDYGSNDYLISSSTAGAFNTIGESWHRNASTTINSSLSLNEAPTNGSWYAGLITGLIFSIPSGFSADFGTLDATNNWTASATTTLNVKTSATNGYTITAWALNNGQMQLGALGIYIAKWSGTNNSPTEWDTDCPDGSSYCGFGYTTNDSTLGSANPDRFTNNADCGAGAGKKCWAGFAIIGAGDPVSDFGRPTTTATTTVAYRVSTNQVQAAGNYQTTIIYIATPNY